MAVVLSWLRIELRRRWRALLVLALLIAISTGVVLTAVAGARRGASAVDRLLDETLPATAVVSPFQPGFDWDVVRALPEVEALTTYPGYSGFSIDEAPGVGETLPYVPADDQAMRTIEAPAVLAGRLADPRRADEAVVTANFVTTFGRGVGDTVTVRLNTVEQAAASIDGGIGQRAPAGPTVPVRIVGVIRSSWFSDDPGSIGRLLPSAGLFASYRGNLGGTPNGPINALVRLRGGAAQLPAFRDDLARVSGRPDIDVQNRDAVAEHARKVLGFESASLLAFGLAALVAAIVLVGQAIARYSATTVADLQVMRAAGMTPVQRVLVALAGPVLAAVLGASIGVGAAWLASRWLPFGTADLFEPAPGLDADWSVLGLGWVAAAALVFAGAAAAGLVAVRTTADRAPIRRSAIATAAARAAVPLPVVVGTRFALEPGRGPTTVPVRPALVGAVTGVVGVLAAFTFSAGVADAGQHPERFGQTFSLLAVFGFGGQDFAPPTPLLAALGGAPDVAGIDDLRLAAAQSGPASVPVFSYQPSGELALVLSDGVAPTADDEVVLAPSSAAALGVGVGSVLPMTGDAGTRSMRVAGIGFVPQTAYNDYDTGAWTTRSGYDALFAGFKQHGALLVLRQGVDPTAALARLQQTAAGVEGGQGLLFITPDVPRQLGEIQNIRVLPVLLGGFLALLALGAVGHALATAVRRRRQDLAVLRALGMTRRQARWVVITQASVLAAAGLALGVPLGVAVGRTLWRIVANSTPLLYVPPNAVWTLALIAPVALVLANLLAAFPARRAARLRVTQVLRAD